MINKKFLQGFAIGIMSVAALEVFNKAVNEKAKKYKLNVNDGYFYTWKEGSLHCYRNRYIAELPFQIRSLCLLQREVYDYQV